MSADRFKRLLTIVNIACGIIVCMLLVFELPKETINDELLSDEGTLTPPILSHLEKFERMIDPPAVVVAAQQKQYAPSPIPDRIALTWTGNPATSQTVTWRTDDSIAYSIGEVIPASPSPYTWLNAKQISGSKKKVKLNDYAAHYHRVHFSSLQPDTLYAYRVGDGNHWSEWLHFKTASRQPYHFSFLYFGDAQSHIKSLFSRVVRQAYTAFPESRFTLHAGDLVRDYRNDVQWGEWFYAAGWINRMIPIMATPGNHEYNKHRLILSPVWSAQFDFPDNGPDHAKLNETVYYIDYQGVRFISLNSHVMYKELWPRLTFMQAKWLKKVLAQNPHKWTIVFHHHPMFASSMTRGDHFWLKHQFKDIYEHYGVDLVFQGHDHNYARGDAASKADDDQGPIYITSVSGGKVYKVNATWADARADTLQLFQHIEVGENRLRYRSFDTVGALNDRFVLTKDADGRKHLTETNAGG